MRALLQCASRGGPTFRPMRGDIDDPAVRCLSGVGRSLQACCAARGRSVIYFMVVSPIARSLGRQWPPMKLHWNFGPHHLPQSTSGYSPQSDCSGYAFFMTRRHSDAASFEVLGKASSLHDDAHDYLDCRSVVKRQFRFGFRRIGADGRS